MSTKIPITLTDSLRQALDDDSKSLDKPIAAIIRGILTDYYQHRGLAVDKRVNRGGYRPRRKSQLSEAS